MKFGFTVNGEDDLIFFLSGLILAGVFLYKSGFKSLDSLSFPMVFVLAVSVIILYVTFISLKALRANKVL